MDACLHRWKLGFNKLSFTSFMRTGLADRTVLHTFRLICFM